MESKNIKNSTVVPIGDYAFSQIVKSKMYFFPKTQKSNSNIKYIFFYRVKPVQAITHYGIIKKRIEDADKMINLIQKMKSFKDPTKKASAYKFSKIVPLENKIPFDTKGTAVQGRINGNFNSIIKLKTTQALFNGK